MHYSLLRHFDFLDATFAYPLIALLNSVEELAVVFFIATELWGFLFSSAVGPAVALADENASDEQADVLDDDKEHDYASHLAHSLKAFIELALITYTVLQK